MSMNAKLGIWVLWRPCRAGEKLFGHVSRACAPLQPGLSHHGPSALSLCQSANRSTDRSVDWSADRSTDGSTDRSVDRSTNWSVDSSADRSADRSGDLSA